MEKSRHKHKNKGLVSKCFLLLSISALPLTGCSNPPRPENFDVRELRGYQESGSDAITAKLMILPGDKSESNSARDWQQSHSSEGNVSGTIDEDKNKEFGWNRSTSFSCYSRDGGELDADTILTDIHAEQNYRCIKSNNPSVITLQSNGTWYAGTPGRTRLTPLDINEVRIVNGEFLPSEENRLCPEIKESKLFIVLDRDPVNMYEIIHPDGTHEYTINKKKAEKSEKKEGCKVNVPFCLPSERGDDIACYREKGKNGIFWMNQNSELYLSFEQQKLFGKDSRLEFIENWKSAASTEPPIYCFRSDTGSDIILKGADHLISQFGGEDNPVRGYQSGNTAWNVPESPEGYHLDGVIGYCLYLNDLWLNTAKEEIGNRN